jgi:hypothetical protein
MTVVAVRIAGVEDVRVERLISNDDKRVNA